jgi:hypothetical protein
MISEEDLQEAIYQAALRGCDCNVKAHKKAIWDAAVTLLADVLRESDPFTVERLLRGLVPELRDSVRRLEELLNPSPYPRITH